MALYKPRKCQLHRSDLIYVCRTCQPNKLCCDECFADDQACVITHNSEVLKIENVCDAIKDTKKVAEEVQNYIDEHYLKDDFDRDVRDIDLRAKKARDAVEYRYNAMMQAIDIYQERAKRRLRQKRKAKMEAFKQKLQKFSANNVDSINKYAISIQQRCDSVLNSHELDGFKELWKEQGEVNRTLQNHCKWYKEKLHEDCHDPDNVIQVTEDSFCRTETPSASIAQPQLTKTLKLAGEASKSVDEKRLSILHVRSEAVLVSFTAIEEDVFVYNYKKGIIARSCEQYQGGGGIACAMLTRDAEYVVILTWKQPSRSRKNKEIENSNRKDKEDKNDTTKSNNSPIIIVHRGTGGDSKKFGRRELKKTHRIENPESLFVNSSGTVCLVDKAQGLFSIDRDDTGSWGLNQVLKPVSDQQKPQWEFKAAVELSKSAFDTDNNTSVACRRYWVVEEFVQYEQQSTQDYRIREYVVMDTREDGTQHDSEPTLLSCRDIDCKTTEGIDLPLRQCQLVTDGEDRVYLIGSYVPKKQDKGQGRNQDQNRVLDQKRRQSSSAELSLRQCQLVTDGEVRINVTDSDSSKQGQGQGQSLTQGQVRDQKRVHVISTDGLYVGTIALANQATALAMDVDTKTLYVACLGNTNVLVYTNVSTRCQKLELKVVTAL